MLKKCKKISEKFFDHFKYFPKDPFEVLMDDPEASEEYCRVLQKCLDDDFDYTVERYGTKVDEHFWDVPDEYID